MDAWEARESAGKAGENAMTRAAEILVESLKCHGTDRLFCVPGESYLALLDALADQRAIQLVACRHEGGAGFMALADAKMTGRPGVVAVSRGPGATNVSIAIHSAQQDAVPLVVLIGQVARGERGRGAFQEVDYGKTFADMAKAVWEVHDAARLGETIARAFHVALSGTPGPAVVALPEDMLSDELDAGEPLTLPPARSEAGAGDVARAAELLARARRPLLIAGGLLDRAAGRHALARAAEAHHLPVALTFKHQEIFDNASPLFAGYLGFKIPRPQVEAMAEADLVLAVGTRLGDVPTQGYSFPRAPLPAQPLIHVYPDPGAIGRVYRNELGMACDPAAFLEALATQNAEVGPERKAWAAELHARAAAMARYEPQQYDDGIDFGAAVLPLARRAPKDAIVVFDAGNFSSWVHRIWPWDGSQLSVGAVGGAMGLGVPGAVAACLRHPGRTVLCFVGDGGAMMTGNELATAMLHGATPKIFVSNNRSYGTIRLHQERDYPRRVVGTELGNPDFAAWARSFGAEGLTLDRQDNAEAVIAEALACERAVVVDVRSSLEAISAYTTIGKLRGDR
jgi:acetolactate synthase I/II/III large subunit